MDRTRPVTRHKAVHVPALPYRHYRLPAHAQTRVRTMAALDRLAQAFGPGGQRLLDWLFLGRR